MNPRLEAALNEATFPNGTLKPLLYLVDAKRVEINSVFRYEEKYMTLLNFAVKYRDDLVKILLERGADVQNPSLRNHPPLQKAIKYRKIEVVRLLLKHGADVTYSHSFNKYSAIYTAVAHLADAIHLELPASAMLLPRYNDSLEILRLVLAVGCNLETHLSPSNTRLQHYSSLLQAIVEDHPTRLHHLIRDPIFGNLFLDQDEPFNPGFVAAMLERRECVRVFLERQRCINKIALAAMLFHREGIVKMFLEEFLEMPWMERAEVLHMAIEANRPNYVETLVARPSVHIFQVHLLVAMKNGYRLDVDIGRSTSVLRILLDYRDVKQNNGSFQALQPHYSQISAMCPNCNHYTLLLEHGTDPLLTELGPGGSFIQHICAGSRFCPIVEHIKQISLLDSKYFSQRIPKMLPEMVTDEEFGRQRIEKFQEELEKLEKIKISHRTVAHPPMTLRGFLLLDANSAARYSRNKRLRAIYATNHKDFQIPYPIFGPTLNYKYRRAERRRGFLEDVGELLRDAMGTHHFPEELVGEVCKFFSDTELQTFACT